MSEPETTGAAEVEASATPVKEVKPKAKKAAPKAKKAAPKAKKAAPKAKKAAPKAKKANTESSGQRGRISQYAGMKITKLVKKNPRREGTSGYSSFELITSGMKFEKYKDLGGKTADLAFCVEKGYVKVD